MILTKGKYMKLAQEVVLIRRSLIDFQIEAEAYLR